MRSVFAAFALALFTFSAAQAQAQTASSAGFEKKNFSYNEWTKGLFSEVVTVTHPGKMIFLGTWATLPANATMPTTRSSVFWLARAPQ